MPHGRAIHGHFAQCLTFQTIFRFVQHRGVMLVPKGVSAAGEAAPATGLSVGMAAARPELTGAHSQHEAMARPVTSHTRPFPMRMEHRAATEGPPGK